MTEVDKAYETIELKIIELKIKPGSKLAMICPENWTPQNCHQFAQYANEMFKFRGYSFELIVFPHGTELFVVSPDAGFN